MSRSPLAVAWLSPGPGHRQADDDVAAAAGRYEIKLELFKDDGTLVDWTAEGIDLHYLGARHQGLLEAIRDQDPDLAAERARVHAEEVIEMLEKFEHPELQEEEAGKERPAGHERAQLRATGQPIRGDRPAFGI